MLSFGVLTHGLQAMLRQPLNYNVTGILIRKVSLSQIASKVVPLLRWFSKVSDITIWPKQSIRQVTSRIASKPVLNANRESQNGRASQQLEPEMFYFGPDYGRRTVSAPNRSADDETRTGSHTPSPQEPAGSVRKHARESGPSNASDQIGQPAPKRSRKSAAPNGLERNGDHPNQLSAHAGLPTQVENSMDSERTNGFSYHQQEQAPSTARAKSSTPANVGLEADIDMGEDGAHMDQDMDVDRGAITGAGAGVGAFGPRDQERIIEPPAPIYTLSNGHSVGVQITPAKVADLKPETKILGVADDHHVTRTMWRPFDPSILAASGEQFCGLWKVSSHDFKSDAQSPPYLSLIDDSDTSFVSAAAWEPGGSLLAIATYNRLDFTGQLLVYNAQNKSLVDALPTAQKVITSLRWQSVGLRLVGFASEPQHSSLVLWDLSLPPDSWAPSSITVPMQIHDVDWASHGNSSVVCASGDGTVCQYKAQPDLIFERKWSSNPIDEDKWTFIRCSWLSEETAVVVTAAAETASIWVPSADVLMKHAHQAFITGLELRPNQIVHPNQVSAHEFATSSMDNTIKIWRFDNTNNKVEGLFKVHMGLSSPVMTLSYSPDGFYVAGASYDQIKIWKAESGIQPIAQWDGQDSDWRGSTLKLRDQDTNGDICSPSNGQQDFDADHSLSWDADSKKLAFGLGNHVSPLHYLTAIKAFIDPCV
jgi:WD40 repeat protein